MTLYIKSADYTFAGDRAVVVSRAHVGVPSPAVASAPFSRNVISGLPEVPVGPVSLTLFDCVVSSSRTGSDRRVAAVGASGRLVRHAGDTNGASVDLPRCAFVRLILLDEGGRLSKEERRVGLAMDHSTIEGVVGTDGCLDLLVEIGQASAYVCSIRRTSIHFAVTQSREDQTVVLRVPPAD